MPKIRVAPAALNDLKKIKEYIETELSNPIAANNVIKRIIKDYSLLEVSPHMGSPLSSKIHIETDFRFLVSGNYLFFTMWMKPMFRFTEFYTVGVIILKLFFEYMTFEPEE